MIFKIIRNDLRRKKVINIAVFIFITMAVVLGAGASNIISSLLQSVTELRTRAVASDLSQMHSGSFDQKEIDNFTGTYSEYIEQQETMKLLNINGQNIHFSEGRTMADTVQDISFVVQNKKFDFILDLENRKLDIQKGEIAVPIYFMQVYSLEVGNIITVAGNNYRYDFIISNYARDYEMNSPLTSSKRFVVNQSDYDEMLAAGAGEPEYLIEFRLKDKSHARTIRTAYIEANLPSNGPTIGGELFLLFNALSDASIAMIIIIISLLLVTVAALCIRLVFLATIDEDLREIGVMKAMGITKKDIKNVYLNKYRLISAAAGIIGYILSFAAVNLFTGNMKLYISSELSGNLKYLLSLASPFAVYLMIVLYCRRVLKKIDKISAVAALRSDIIENEKKRITGFALYKNKRFNINIYLGIMDVLQRFKLYRLLVVIFIVCTFMIILPLNIYNTMNSPEFSTYMGIGKCDMRIDMRKTDTITEDVLRLQEQLEQDPDIEKYASYITCSYPVKNEEGSWDYILIETGDFNVFPLNYLSGRAPEKDGEIAISFANSSPDGLNKTIGDELIVKVGNSEKLMKVCGIYQDITNGGRTAKASASLGLNETAVLWYIVNIDTLPGTDIQDKKMQYQKTFSTAQVNDIREYTRQTLGNIIEQLRIVVFGAAAVANIILILVTSLFLKMLLSKDKSRIAIMRSTGLTMKDIRLQYIAGMFTVLIPGLLSGLIVSEVLGEFLVSAAMSAMGAARIEFVISVLQTWVLCPSLLIAVVLVTTSLSCRMSAEKDLSTVLRV